MSKEIEEIEKMLAKIKHDENGKFPDNDSFFTYIELLRNAEKHIRTLLTALKEAEEKVLRVVRGEFTQVCSYCGWEAPPPSGWEKLEKHIQECPQHPLTRERGRARELEDQLSACQRELDRARKRQERKGVEDGLWKKSRKKLRVGQGC